MPAMIWREMVAYLKSSHATGRTSTSASSCRIHALLFSVESGM